MACAGDHGGIVRAEAELRAAEAQPCFFRAPLHRAAQRLVCGNAARKRKRAHAALHRCAHGFLRQRFHHGMLEGSCNIRSAERFAALLRRVHQIDDRRFQPGEAEIERWLVVKARMEGKRMGIAFARKRFKCRPAGIAKPQHARHLVERFACSINVQ